MNTLSLHNICVNKNGQALLSDVNLELSGNSIVGLIGPNGAGKSTLLRVMAGLESTAPGLVSLFGQNIKTFRKQELGRQLAYLPQSADCAWPLKVEKIIALGRLPHGAAPTKLSREDIKIIKQVMHDTDIEHLIGRTLNTLSGGEKMRVMLARALASEPQILLADEPIASLDPLHQLEVMALLTRIAKRGTTVVVVLHELNLAMRFCDQLALLHKGKLLARGEPTKVLSPALLQQAYQIKALYGEYGDGEYGERPWVIPCEKLPEIK